MKLAANQDGGRCDLLMLLVGARDAVMQFLRPVLAAHGLTEPQWRILSVLGESGPLTSSKLASRCEILAPSLTGILRRMEESDLVDKRVLKSDRRFAVVSLTSKGASLVPLVEQAVKTVYEDIERLVDREVLLSAYAGMDDLIRKLGDRISPEGGRVLDTACEVSDVVDP